MAAPTVLSAKQINTLLVGKNMTITETQTDKKNGKTISHAAIFAETGSILPRHSSSAAQLFTSSLNSDVALCIKNNMKIQRRSAVSCGFVAPHSPGIYRFYAQNKMP